MIFGISLMAMMKTVLLRGKNETAPPLHPKQSFGCRVKDVISKFEL